MLTAKYKKNSNIFDYNNQFIPTDKYYSKSSYKKADGYSPGIANINSLQVMLLNIGQ